MTPDTTAPVDPAAAPVVDPAAAPVDPADAPVVDPAAAPVDPAQAPAPAPVPTTVLGGLVSLTEVDHVTGQEVTHYGLVVGSNVDEHGAAQLCVTWLQAPVELPAAVLAVL